MIEVFLTLLALLVLLWAIGLLYLRGPDLIAFDQPSGQIVNAGQSASQEFKAVVASLDGVAQLLKDTPRRQHLALLRDYINNVFSLDEAGLQLIPVDAAGVKAEWVLAPNVDTSRRLLYIHGGAYTMGSPKSHRRLTSKF